MTRRLLPRFRSAPNPPSIPELPAGNWSRIAVPADLGKLDYGTRDEEVRSQVQSIPSPWARMLLFKNALESDMHPARPLVENEILDGFQFLWSLGQLRGVPISFPLRRVDEMMAQARGLSQRANDFATALKELMPRWKRGDEPREISSLVIAVVREKVVLGSSPFTVLFTAEDAASHATGEFFRYASGAPRRKLKDRPPAFQRYVAQVLLTQLNASNLENDRDVDWVTTRRLLSPWLENEVRECEQARPQFAANLRLQGDDWQRAASSLSLTPLDQAFGGLALFKTEGGEIQGSRWRLRSGRAVDQQPPLIVDPKSFDGVFYEGAAKVSLSQSGDLDRSVLPQINVQYPWVDPEKDWFTERLLLLGSPVDPANVLGRAAGSHDAAADDVLSADRLILPLRADILRFFAPDALARMVQIKVQPGRQVEIALTLLIGAEGDSARELIIRKRYDSAQILQVSGPSFALWPSFSDTRWHDYSLLRYDTNAAAAEMFEVSAFSEGVRLEGDSERRTSNIEVLSFKKAPEAIAIRSTVKGTGAETEEFGLLLPHFREITNQTQMSWNVGVDFGTSNTVVTVRPDDQSAPTEFVADDLLLPLTKLNDEERRLLDSYFFPPRISAGPFGTAVLYFRQLRNYMLARHGLAVRVNVPFSGYVQPDDRNAVAGDLKWSREQSVAFLTSSFLRHVLSTIIAHALQQGIDPGRLRFAWAYPRAFNGGQVNQLRGLWEGVGREFAENGINVRISAEPIDESSAILRHFVDSGAAGVAGQLTILLDVGGGTSDIAAYAEGRALLLDSLMLGGRNLTGQRLQGATYDRLRNPFVAAFSQWARDNQLEQYPDSAKALAKYLNDGQDHLAFSYLLGTGWFASNGQRFTGEEVCHRFQALILYMYGALFHYLGIAVRDLIARQVVPPSTLPYSIMVAGNGSRYLDWLTDLTPMRGDNAFKVLLATVLARSALGEAIPTDLSRIELSPKPKREVALGLVASVAPNLDEAHAANTSLVGESMTITTSSMATRSFSAEGRFRDDDLIEADSVASVSWTSGPMEIQRYHTTILELAPALSRYAAHWTATADRYRKLFRRLTAAELQQETRQRLHFIAMQEGGFRGSIFALEAATVMDLMMQDLFDPSPGATTGAEAGGRQGLPR